MLHEIKTLKYCGIMKKKHIQNVLAASSNGEIAYVCGKCGKIIQKEDSICKHCGARLGDIKCPFCNFKGSVDDFKRDTCPRCGRKNTGTTGQAAARGKKTGDDNGLSGISARFYWTFFFGLLIINILLVLFFLYFFGII